MRLRISIRGLVRRSVRPSVPLSHVIFRRVLGASCAVYSALFIWLLMHFRSCLDCDRIVIPTFSSAPHPFFRRGALPRQVPSLDRRCQRVGQSPLGLQGRPFRVHRIGLFRHLQLPSDLRHSGIHLPQHFVRLFVPISAGVLFGLALLRPWRLLLLLTQVGLFRNLSIVSFFCRFDRANRNRIHVFFS